MFCFLLWLVTSTDAIINSFCLIFTRLTFTRALSPGAGLQWIANVQWKHYWHFGGSDLGVAASRILDTLPALSQPQFPMCNNQILIPQTYHTGLNGSWTHRAQASICQHTVGLGAVAWMWPGLCGPLTPLLMEQAHGQSSPAPISADMPQPFTTALPAPAFHHGFALTWEPEILILTLLTCPSCSFLGGNDELPIIK